MIPNLSMGNYPRAGPPAAWDNPHMPTPLAERLRRLRAASGLDAKALSRAAGLNETFVRDIEKGRTRSPSESNLRKLAAALRVPLTQLVEPTPGLADPQQDFELPAPSGDMVEEFAATQDAVATHLRAAKPRVSQREIARHALAVWHDLQNLPARMTFAQRLEFTMSEFRSKHPSRHGFAASDEEADG